MTELLGLEDISEVFRRRPYLLDSHEIRVALAELREMLPQHIDAKRMLVTMPSLVYPQNRTTLPMQMRHAFAS